MTRSARTDATAGSSAASVELTGDPEAVRRARAFVGTELSNLDSNLLDSVELVVTELVTNAVLHGAAPIRLTLAVLDGTVRVEVRDVGRRMPLQMPATGETMTGRGLALVSALSSGNWGVRPDREGKSVWAEVSAEPAEEALAADVDALLATWDERSFEEDECFELRLGAVPTDLLLAAKAHIDNLVRECTLAASGAVLPGGAELPADLAALVQTVVHEFEGARAQLKQQALAAAARGARQTDVRLVLPLSAAEAGERYLAALDDADRYARAARLLTLESPPAHRVFRRWYVQALVDQLRAVAVGAAPPVVATFPDRLADEVTELAPLREVASRLASLQALTAALTGARDVAEVAELVVRHAVEAFGAWSARVYLVEGDELRVAGQLGDTAAAADTYLRIPLTAELPGPVALRTGQQVLVRDRRDFARRFPELSAAFGGDRSLLVAPLTIGEHRLGAVSLTYPRLSQISEETQVATLTTLAGLSAQALERAVATARAAEANERLTFLAEASVVLASSLDYRTVLEAVAGLVVPATADWCAIQLLNREATLETVALTAADPSRVGWALQLGSRYPVDMSSTMGAPNVVRTGASELYREIPQEMLDSAAVDEEHRRAIRDLHLTSALVVPLTGRTGVIGALTMIYSESGRHYGDADVTFAEDLARRAALAVETALSFQEQSGRLASVTRIAEAAQHAILAPPPPQIGPVALAARYVSAATEALIGGDMYEVVERDGAVRLLIGDVRGKGLEAVRLATVVLGEFRAAAVEVDHLTDLAIQMDLRLRRYLEDEDFVTAVLAEVADDGRFALVHCGHPPALMAIQGQVRTVDAPQSLPLGLGPEPTPVTGRLAVGDRLLLYTDGLIEARDGNRRFVDPAPLMRGLAIGPLEDVPERVLTCLREAVGGDLTDDLALLAAEFRGNGDPPHGGA
jgi:serine phosphatase RsbU (regulator of sigma subunit)/anti-sigma regulatory factor (Ser/Thr protein kinase)